MLHLRTVTPLTAGEQVSIAELGDDLGLSKAEVRFFTGFLGMDRISTAGNLSVLDMLVSVGDAALTDTDRSMVRYLVHAHTMQHIAPPAIRLVGSLRDKLAIPHASAFALGNQGCVCGLYALGVVESLLRAEPPGATALIVVGEKASSPDARLIPRTTLLGDGAVAILVGLDGPGDAVLATAHRTLGEFHESRNMSRAVLKQYQQMHTPMITAVITEALETAGLELSDVALVLPHNVNRFAWVDIARQLDVPLERIFLDNVAMTGHCYGADPFVNLEAARDAQLIGPGDTVLMVSAGMGATFTATAVRIGAGGCRDV